MLLEVVAEELAAVVGMDELDRVEAKLVVDLGNVVHDELFRLTLGDCVGAGDEPGGVVHTHVQASALAEAWWHGATGVVVQAFAGNIGSFPHFIENGGPVSFAKGARIAFEVGQVRFGELESSRGAVLHQP